MKKTIRIEGMSCGHCEKRVKDALGELGADVKKVSASDGLAEVEINSNIAIQKMREAVEDVGYDVIEVI